ncbi:YoaK family protein [Ruminococcus sp.]|uniref:YoaK family protein n=1 Tax=Ruminococcus sp. TaxID=41978 RepID=UPI0025EE2298|nr:YoaK family protein [Ruminococcus sp.]
MQTSESFTLSALLSFSGGLQDAYTYNIRGRVFANAQTGNVVLMSQNFMLGKFGAGLHYLCPLVSFALGIFIAERIENRFKDSKSLHWRQIIILIEMIVLTAVGFLPSELDMPANMLVSFACAMQVQTFRTVRGYGYASTMCIGNLRSGTESFSQYLRDRNRDALFKSLHFFGIILFFAIGAGFGGVVSSIFGIRTIWISAVLLLLAAVMMIRKKVDI